jgi:hypothetical protein
MPGQRLCRGHMLADSALLIMLCMPLHRAHAVHTAAPHVH